MGACATPPNLAIVMEWCAGATLYHELHVKEQAEALTLHECLDIALQTARGMGYGHDWEVRSNIPESAF
jgi:serine/threonine protein kinase